MTDLYFIVGMFLGLARMGYRYAVDYPKIHAQRYNKIDNDWQFGFFFWTLGQTVLLILLWIPVLVAYGFYLLFKRYANKD
uniref:Transmembrane protein n=1 Tax=Caulobacter phage BL57 TaxID=3348355 RepID=A0AB74UMV2_9VIRU